MPQQLTGGERLNLSARARAGHLLLGWPLRGASVALGVRFGHLHLGQPLRGAGVALGVRSGALRFGMVGRASAAASPVRRGRLRIVVHAAEVPARWSGAYGRSLVVRWPSCAAAISPPGALAGPGRSAGEYVVPLPAVWQAEALPAEFIGRDLAALALLRGEAWALDESRLLVGGRVMIGEGGAEIWFLDADELALWVDDRIRELAGYLGIIGLQASETRDRLISQHRGRVAGVVPKLARAAGKIADGPRKAALFADLTWIQRRM